MVTGVLSNYEATVLIIKHFNEVACTQLEETGSLKQENHTVVQITSTTHGSFKVSSLTDTQINSCPEPNQLRDINGNCRDVAN
ncbi:hypothetical protein HUJ05_002078 [Dendroctonus ponderosae]|nr:hypothetical protein HUJ05_002078 [Dendroctonus ponderosae]